MATSSNIRAVELEELRKRNLTKQPKWQALDAAATADNAEPAAGGMTVSMDSWFRQQKQNKQSIHKKRTEATQNLHKGTAAPDAAYVAVGYHEQKENAELIRKQRSEATQNLHKGTAAPDAAYVAVGYHEQKEKAEYIRKQRSEATQNLRKGTAAPDAALVQVGYDSSIKIKEELKKKKHEAAEYMHSYRGHADAVSKPKLVSTGSGDSGASSTAGGSVDEQTTSVKKPDVVAPVPKKNYNPSPVTMSSTPSPVTISTSKTHSINTTSTTSVNAKQTTATKATTTKTSTPAVETKDETKKEQSTDAPVKDPVSEKDPSATINAETPTIGKDEAKAAVELPTVDKKQSEAPVKTPVIKSNNKKKNTTTKKNGKNSGSTKASSPSSTEDDSIPDKKQSEAPAKTPVIKSNNKKKTTTTKKNGKNSGSTKASSPSSTAVDEDDSIPALKEEETVAVPTPSEATTEQKQQQQIPVKEEPRHNRAEKKARKMMEKLGMRLIPGIQRVTIKKTNPDAVFAINKPDVFKSPTTNTYVVFGECKSEGGFGNGSGAVPAASAATQAAAAKQFREPVPVTDDDVSEIPLMSPAEEVEDVTVETVDSPTEVEKEEVSKDVQLVMDQAGCSKSRAIKALKENDNDLVNAIMALTT